MPDHSTVYLHAAKDAGFNDRLQKARKACAEAQQDDLDELMADAAKAKDLVKIQGIRAQADILKFKLVKVLPKIYGDTPAQVNIDNRSVNVVLSDDQRVALQDRLKRLQNPE